MLRKQLIIGIALLGIFASFILYQITATFIDDDKYPPVGKLVDIGGYKLHLNASGDGNVTVVCDAGLSGTSLGWSLVQSEVSKFARVCSYDRAGYAWSGLSPLKRTSLNMAKELHTLLEKARMPPPYILVGHSFGGSNMLLFADLYPEEVLGVVLVDSVHEDMLKELPIPPQSFFDKSMNASIQWLLAACGYKRLKGPSAEIQQMFLPLPKEIRDSYIAQMHKTNYSRIVSQEMNCLEESLSQLAQCHLQDKPLVVISAGITTSEGNKWGCLQEKLLSKSNKSKQLIAENSDHMINHHQPLIIVDAIREMANIASSGKNG